MQREKQSAALTSIIAAIFLTSLKLIVGILTGSLGIISEGLHSLLDLCAASVTLYAVRTSAKPPDEEHRYGHGKVESLAGFVETILLLVTCGWIVYEALRRLFTGSVQVEASLIGFGVMGLSIVVDLSRSCVLYKTARKYQSQALEADALHFSSDVLSSSVVLVGLFFVRLGYAWVDSLAALGVAIVIIWVGLRLGRRTTDALLDRAPPGLPKKIEEEAKRCDGILEVTRVRIRKVGLDTFVDINVSIDRNASLEKAHAIAREVERKIQSLLPGADTVVHMDPISTEGTKIIDQIKNLATEIPEIKSVHNIHIREMARKFHLDVHLEVDSKLKVREAHQIASNFEKMLRKEIKNLAEVVTHVEPLEEETKSGEDITTTSSPLVREIQRLILQLPEVKDLHKVTIHKANGKYDITLHCKVKDETTTQRAHEIATQIENIIRSRLEDIDHVLVHIEPLVEGADA
ncbi:cation-efflux pump [Candidatus Bathyarchaeota archaeon]|nr:cation-efflux pump [Candidatus Bathyarchaeota archaeon]